MANDQQEKCKECGCKCNKCTTNHHDDVHLHVEIENLKQKLVERDNHIATMENNVLNEANKYPNGEVAALQEELLTWQDKYKRLYEGHRRIQRVNQGLEDKLLRLVDICESEKGTLTKDVATLSHKLAEANYSIKKLTGDNERYKNDVALAIQFLQCKQGNFVAQKLDSLPNEVQAKVSLYVTGGGSTKRKQPEEKKLPPEIKSIKVPIPTFPPTAMVYSIPKTTTIHDRFYEKDDTENSSVDIVSAAIMAKVLEERERERALTKHCDTCTCSKTLKIIHDTTTHDIGTQTGDYKTSLCLRCNTNLESPTNIMKLVKNDTNNKSKTVPIYTHDYDSNLLQVVKVEPNNYLKENDVNSLSSRHPNVKKFKNHPPTSNSSHNSKSTDCDPNQELQEDSPLLDIKKNDLEKLNSNLKHHHLCSQSPKPFQQQSGECDDDSSAKKSLKGPRYCSVRLQSGSKNILLDNIHNNIAPVLYTHPTDRKTKKDDHNYANKIFNGHTNSQTVSYSTITTSQELNPPGTQSYSSEDRKSINLVDESLQNQQKVAEWIQNNQDNMGNEFSSPDNSRSDSLKKDLVTVDPTRYAEMENNVKKFLFGESQGEFLKKVAIGKQNYQNLRDYNNSVNCEKQQISRSNSHTETDI